MALCLPENMKSPGANTVLLLLIVNPDPKDEDDKKQRQLAAIRETILSTKPNVRLRGRGRTEEEIVSDPSSGEMSKPPACF